MTGLAVLFPGQGAYYSGALQETRVVYPEVDAVFYAVDQVAERRLRKSVSELVWRSGRKGLDEILSASPDLLQLAIYAISVATFRVLTKEGMRPSVLVGHSFGEIAALVCAGRYSVEDGAGIVCDRVESLAMAADADGCMVAVQAPAERVRQALALMGDKRAALAVLNHDSQTVAAGSTASMAQLLALCQAMKWSALRINSPYAFHSPLMAGAVAEFSRRLNQYRAAPARLRVHSAIHQRDYRADDDPAVFLAQHLVMPVHFGDTLRRLAGEGIDTYVECGALDALTKITKLVLKGRDCRSFASIGNGSAEMSQLRAFITAIHQGENNMQTTTNAVTMNQLDEFWERNGLRILSFMKSELQNFVSGQLASPAAPAPAPAIPAAPAAAQVPPAPQSAAAMARPQLFAEVAQMYAEAMEYPTEVFTETVELEAELGIDSVRQTELMARLSERYRLPQRPADFRMSDYRTMGQIVDFVHTNLPTAQAA